MTVGGGAGGCGFGKMAIPPPNTSAAVNKEMRTPTGRETSLRSSFEEELDGVLSLMGRVSRAGRLARAT